MTKQENIFYLYNQLENNGKKGEALGFISDVCGVKKTSIKSHWLQNQELPDYMLTKDNEHKLDEIISYLQKQIANQNKVKV